MLTVVVNGQRSGPAPITVVARSIGILSLNQGGSGPAAMQMPDANGNVPLNSLSSTVRPGQVGVFYGTGAGAVTFDETRGAPLENLNADIRAIIGGREARILFKGRTPGLVGLDQFNVEIPEGVSGCYVPVAFQSGNVISNFTSISVSNGGPCSDPGGYSSDQIGNAQISGSMRAAGISLVRVNTKFNAGALGTIEATQDVGSAAFSRIDYTILVASAPSYTAIGSCIVSVVRQSQGSSSGTSTVTYLDAGTALNLTGPNGTKQLPKLSEIGYSAMLGGGVPIPGQAPPPPLFLSPGTYTLDNGAGGRDVGPFTATLNIPPQLEWRDKGATVITVPRSQDLVVSWTGGGPDDNVFIGGVSMLAEGNRLSSRGGTFSCTARASAGSFRVPALVLLSLPPSVVISGTPSGTLSVSSGPPAATFSAPGMDHTQFGFLSSVVRSAVFQ